MTIDVLSCPRGALEHTEPHKSGSCARTDGDNLKCFDVVCDLYPEAPGRRQLSTRSNDLMPTVLFMMQHLLDLVHADKDLAYFLSSESLAKISQAAVLQIDLGAKRSGRQHQLVDASGEHTSGECLQQMETARANVEETVDLFVLTICAPHTVTVPEASLAPEGGFC